MDEYRLTGVLTNFPTRVTLRNDGCGTSNDRGQGYPDANEGSGICWGFSDDAMEMG